MAGSAGGSTAYADVPDYLETVHDNWLSGYNTYKKLPDGKTVNQLLNNKIGNAGTNPYGSVSGLTNPSTIVDSIMERWNAIKSDIDGLTQGDLNSVLSEAKTNVSSAIGSAIGSTIDGEIDSILNASTQHVVDFVLSAVRSTIGNAQVNMAVGTDRRLKDSVINNIGLFAQEAMNDITASLASGSLEDALSVIDQAVQRTSNLTSTLLSSVMQDVYNIVDSQIIDNMVNSFDESSRTRYNRDVGKWSAAMAKAGAAHTSAFVMGKAMFEIERLKSVDDYEAKLKMAIMDKALSVAGTSSSTVYGALVEAFKTTHAERLARFQTILTEAIKYHLTLYATTIDATKAELANAYVLHGNVAQNWVSDYYRLYIQHNEALNRSIMAYVQARLSNDLNVMRHHEWVEQFFSEIEKLDYMMNREWTLTRYDIAVKYDLWDFEVFQKAANVLASISGATAVGSETIPARSSVIGGALGGAAMGAAIPGAGPIGAAIGGILGGATAIFDR